MVKRRNPLIYSYIMGALNETRRFKPLHTVIYYNVPSNTIKIGSEISVATPLRCYENTKVTKEYFAQ